MKARSTSALRSASALSRLGSKVLTYIDLFVRTVCILMGLIASSWVRFVDGEPPPAVANNVAGMNSPHVVAPSSSSPVIRIPTSAWQLGYTHPPLIR